MKVVNDLYYNIKEVPFYKSQFIDDPKKKNILFVDIIMSNFDFYTMMIPYLALGGEDSEYQTAVTGMYRYSEINDIPEKYLSEHEVKWADVIVIGMSLEQFNGEGRLYDELREINPDIVIIQTVEYDFYEIKKDHHDLDFTPEEMQNFTGKQKKELQQGMIDRHEDNCRGADRLIVLNPNLANKLIAKGFKDVRWCPIYIDEETFKANIDFAETLGLKNTDGIVFLSCELIDSTRSAFKEYIPIFQKLKKKYKEKFRLVVIGKNPNRIFPDLGFQVDRLQRGSIVNQFRAIVRSSADIHLILNKKNEYSNNTESMYTYIERGLFGVPIVSIPVSPYKEIIDNKVNGYLIKSRGDLESLVKEFMKDKEGLREVSSKLKNDIVAQFQLDEEKRDNLIRIFFDVNPTVEESERDEFEEPDED